MPVDQAKRMDSSWHKWGVQIFAFNPFETQYILYSNWIICTIILSKNHLEKPPANALLGTNNQHFLKMIFLFPRWDILLPWRVFHTTVPPSTCQPSSVPPNCIHSRISQKFLCRRGHEAFPTSYQFQSLIFQFPTYSPSSGSLPDIFRPGRVTFSKENWKIREC